VWPIFPGKNGLKLFFSNHSAPVSRRLILPLPAPTTSFVAVRLETRPSRRSFRDPGKPEMKTGKGIIGLTAEIGK
jgi:hypothetical protein